MGIKAGEDTFYQAQRGIVQNGLVLNLDAGVRDSYDSGTTWRDLKGGNDGTLINEPTFDRDNGGSIVFDGTNDRISMPTTNLISGWSQLTYNVWVNVSQISTTHWPGFISTYTSSVGFNTSVGQWQNTQRIWYEVDTVNGNYYGGGSGANTFSLNTWFNACLVYNGSNVYGYLNNTLDKEFSATGNLKNISSLNIGSHDPSTGGAFLNGKISFAQIYNRALTSDEVARNYNATRHRFGV